MSHPGPSPGVAQHMRRSHRLGEPQLAELKKLVGIVGPTNAAVVLGCSVPVVEELVAGGVALRRTIERVSDCLDILRREP